MIENILKLALDIGSSDVHIAVDTKPIFRVDGDLIESELDIVKEDILKKYLNECLSDKEKKKYEEDGHVDFSKNILDIRVRVNVYRKLGNDSITFRIIRNNTMKLSELNRMGDLSWILKNKNGLALITGPCGSGKSSTLAALIDEINKNSRKHVITIEDPIEYIFKSNKSIISQREVGEDTKSFEKGIISALRQDPDIIVIGEMREKNVIREAITAAETGHLVISTLHTKSASKTIDRIVDVFSGEEKNQIRMQLSSVLLGVISQVLVKKKHSGRIMVSEIMKANNAIRSSIREGKVHQIDNYIQTGRKEGMQTLMTSLEKALKEGYIDYKILEEYEEKL